MFKVRNPKRYLVKCSSGCCLVKLVTGTYVPSDASSGGDWRVRRGLKKAAPWCVCDGELGQLECVLCLASPFFSSQSLRLCRLFMISMHTSSSQHGPHCAPTWKRSPCRALRLIGKAEAQVQTLPPPLSSCVTGGNTSCMTRVAAPWLRAIGSTCRLFGYLSKLIHRKHLRQYLAPRVSC